MRCRINQGIHRPDRMMIIIIGSVSQEPSADSKILSRRMLLGGYLWWCTAVAKVTVSLQFKVGVSHHQP